MKIPSSSLEQRTRLMGDKRWMHITGNDVLSGRLWDFPGVYVIYLDGVLSYVGQSNTPRFRFRQHGFGQTGNKFITPWGEFDHFLVKIKYSVQYGKEAMIEKRLIKRIQPRFNIYKLKARKYAAVY